MGATPWTEMTTPETVYTAGIVSGVQDKFVLFLFETSGGNITATPYTEMSISATSHTEMTGPVTPWTQQTL